ncbi:MAG: BTAD domain-containing putative transcriptional regulator [Acidimicrobiia bacterium]
MAVEGDDLRFALLGPLEVDRSGTALDLGGPKQRAVLALLLIEHNRVVSLDRLVDQLWGGQPPARAAASLQAYVSNLRRTLEPERPARARARLLVSQAPGYALRVPPEAIDAVEFEAAVREGHELLVSAQPAAARETLAAALRRWRGPALADFLFEPFAQAEVARLEELRFAATEDRLAADLALGDHAAATADLERLVVERPLRERLWELLMLAMYRCGRQADALRAFQDARRLLVEELGIEPGPALGRLEAQVLEHDPDLDWEPPPERATTRRVASTPVAPAPLAAVPVSGVVEPRLVGRAEPLARLEAALAAVVGGQGRVTLVSGEAGIGKTRLVEELAGRAIEHGATVAWGRCVESEAVAPLSPWVQIAEDLLGSDWVPRLAELLGPDEAVLPQVVPGVALDERPPAPAVADLAAARFRVYDTAVTGVARLAEQEPRVLVLEDLQWADMPTLQLLVHLATRIAGQRILMVATYRDEGAEVPEPLGDVLGSLARARGTVHVPLSGLDSDGVGELIATRAGLEPDRSLVDAVYDRTEGNPFFVTELVSLLASEKHLDAGTATAAVTTTIPPGVRDVLRRRLARLPEGTNALLLLAATIGREFDVATLTAARETADEAVLDHLDTALVSGLVVEGDAPGHFRFAHALLQETIYRGASEIRRARLHARLAQVLSDRVAADPALVSVVAHHAWKAAPVIGPDAALPHLVLAADHSMQLLAHESAELHLRRALALIDTLPLSSDAAHELAVQVRLGILRVATEGYVSPGAVAAFERARELTAAVEEAGDALAALWGAWSVSFSSARFADADAMSEELEALGERTGEPLCLVRARLARGMTRWARSDLTGARDDLETAVVLSEKAAEISPADAFGQHPGVIACAMGAVVSWLAGLRERSAELAAEALAGTDTAHRPLEGALALACDATIAVLEGDDAKVSERAAEIIDVGKAHGVAYDLIAQAEIFDGWAMAVRGDVEAGRRRAVAGYEAARAGGARLLDPLFVGLHADTERRAGRLADALGAADEALSLAESTGERWYEPEIHRLRAAVLAGLGRADEAREAARVALAVAGRQGAVPFEQRAAALVDQLG